MLNVGCFLVSFRFQLRALSREMFSVMYADEGVGLAAPQVGMNIRMMVFNPAGTPTKSAQEVTLVNPRIIESSKKTEVGEEGCLSFRDKGAWRDSPYLDLAERPSG